MEFLQPTVIDTKVISAEHPQDYFNTILSSVNDHIVRIGIMTEPYFWHYTTTVIFIPAPY